MELCGYLVPAEKSWLLSFICKVKTEGIQNQSATWSKLYDAYKINENVFQGSVALRPHVTQAPSLVQ